MSVRLDHGKDELDEVHEINVTPFIDVILVLLIIFMIAAPLATVDISVDLPSSTAQQQPRPDKPQYLTVKPDLSLAVGDTPITAMTHIAIQERLDGKAGRLVTSHRLKTKQHLRGEFLRWARPLAAPNRPRP
jgi:biopolymer transport protein ExbD